MSAEKLDTKNNFSSSQTDDLPEIIFKSAVSATALLESIALFELLGAKWMLSVTAKYWSAELHEHASDEINHTKLVQDAAKSLRWKLSPSDLIRERDLSRAAYEATEEYLSKLSRRVFRMVRSNSEEGHKIALASYAVLAFLIERRIMKIYPHFAKHGPTEEIQSMAKSIITDERKHLGFVTNKLPDGLEYAASTQEAIICLEAELASKWIEKIVCALEH